jgi:glycosyltransferase involved in cell wall biosynthesis
MLRECLQSISQQTYGNIEIVVVNDGGETIREMVSSLELGREVQFIDHEVRKGPAAARNSGIKAAMGKYIAYLDDDDVYYPDHISELVNFLEIHRSFVAYSDAVKVLQYKSDGEYLTKESEHMNSIDFDAEKLLVSNYIPVICVSHRKDCVENIGYFDDNLFTHEDWDFFIRLSSIYSFGHVSKITCEYRLKLDDSSATTQKRANFLKTAKEIHRRHRKPLINRSLLLKQKIFIAKQSILFLLWRILIVQENLSGRKYLNIRRYLL